MREAGEVWRHLEPNLEQLQFGRADGSPGLWMQHPAVEPLEMLVTDPGVVVVAANTSTGGPGFHRRMCSDLHELGARLGLAWDPSDGVEFSDETGYLERGDAAAVDTAMLAWLGAVLTAVSQDAELVSIAMSPAWTPIGTPNAVSTAMRPRDRASSSRTSSLMFLPLTAGPARPA